MDFALPIVFMSIMGLAMFVYVILDGYDLGIGILLPLGSDNEKDYMIASIGPFWDANETWIVLGVGVLLIAFPKAHGLVLTSLYLPVTLMLMGLILRGVAFDFRVKAGSDKKQFWNRAFFIGSLLATLCQGWMLGAYVTGLSSSKLSTLFSCLIGLSLPALYILLGAGWLLIKAEGQLQLKALKWARRALLPMGLALILVSVATPLVSETIAAKWFTLPNTIGLVPIPLSCLAAFIAIDRLSRNPKILQSGYAWAVYACTVFICVMATVGLAYSLYPDIVIGKLTIWQAASATESLLFVLIGIVISVPAIIAYTIFVYKVFSGKTIELKYE